MNLTVYDWLIMVVSIIALRLISLGTKKYMRGVADFLSANRSAGRYLLTISGEMGGTGAISVVALFEMYYAAGMPPVFWGFMSIPVTAIITLTGWVYYRLRETRALTLAQFLEMRYSRRFRVFAGIVCWASGIINFGIFPAVAARFFVYFCGLQPAFHPIPGLEFTMPTFVPVMAVDLALALMFVTMGGQISVMVTECAQGMVSAFAFIIIAASVLIKVSWPKMVAALSQAPANASMIHPFHTSQIKDFNVWFFLIGLFASFYAANTWQGCSGFQSSGRSPHEQKMGNIIRVWRTLPLTVMTILLGLAALCIFKLPEYAGMASAVNASLSQIGSDTIRDQMRIPIALAHFLPFGIKGLFATVMLFFSFTCHDTYMHSWGSIFIQDVVMPFRKRPVTPEQHIKWLRWSIIGVAIFSFFFSWFYPQNQPILMFFAITGTIWIAGSGIVLIGGLYWRKGTTPAAYTAIITGALVGVAGLIVPGLYKAHYHHEFPVNGQVLYFLGMCSAMVLYIIVSLATCRKGDEFNLDRMLHRGAYGLPEAEQPEELRTSRWMQLVGITKEFSKYDRILAIALLVWNFGWFAAFGVITVINLKFNVSTPWWSSFWHFYILSLFTLSIPATIWFTIGGVMDIKALFHTLATAVRDHTDDGRVVHETNEDAPALTEEPMAKIGE